MARKRTPPIETKVTETKVTETKVTDTKVAEAKPSVIAQTPGAAEGRRHGRGARIHGSAPKPVRQSQAA